MNNSIKIGIVGAGIQGVSNALFLQKKGFDVTLFDRDEPGSPAASYGNAGHFSPYASLSLNRTDVLADVPAMLLSSTGPLALKWNYVPKMIPWFIKFILNDKDLKSRELEIKVRDELGVRQQLVNKHEIHDLEPNIKPFYHAGVYYPYARHARNPKKILLKLFELFLKKGGQFEKSNIQEIKFENEKPIFKTENNEFKFDKIVIACGAFSKKLTDNLGEKIPLDTERGYHVHFKDCDHLLSRPVIFSNRGFGITPMEQGLRVVGTVEFGGLENPLSKSRIKNLINNAKYMLGDLPEHEDEWLGFRPTLPDFLPVMGPSKNYKNVFYCFGHHHLGWTLGPISGKIVSGMVAEENTNLDLNPYSSHRFA